MQTVAVAAAASTVSARGLPGSLVPSFVAKEDEGNCCCFVVSLWTLWLHSRVSSGQFMHNVCALFPQAACITLFCLQPLAAVKHGEEGIFPSSNPAGQMVCPSVVDSCLLSLSLSLRQGGHQPERGNCVARRPFCDCALAHDGPTSQWVQKNENFKYLDTVVGLLRHVLVILTTADETW